MFGGRKQENSSEKIGVYWGTFDPPTLAHVQITLKSLEQLGLSRLIVVVNDNTNTKKTYKIPGKDRVKILQWIFSEQKDKDKVSIVRQTDSHLLSYDEVKKRHPNQQIYAIVGQDSFEKMLPFESEKNDGNPCAKYDHIVVVPRGTNDSLSQEITTLENVTILDIERKYLEISSTRLREAIEKEQGDLALEYTSSFVLFYVEGCNFFNGNGTATDRSNTGSWEKELASFKEGLDVGDEAMVSSAFGQASDTARLLTRKP